MRSLWALAAAVPLGLTAPVNNDSPEPGRKVIVGMKPGPQMMAMGSLDGNVVTGAAPGAPRNSGRGAPEITSTGLTGSVAQLLGNGNRFQHIRPTYQYNIGRWKGFAAQINDTDVKNLRNDPLVEYVEYDGLLYTQQWPWDHWGSTSSEEEPEEEEEDHEVVWPNTGKNPGVGLTTSQTGSSEMDQSGGLTSPDGGTASVMPPTVGSQPNAPWGLGRISHRQKGVAEYLYETSAGEGTCVYVLDTGLDDTHPEFQGRAKFLRNFEKTDGSDRDLFGHGTHVAGTIGSFTYGVAKKALIFGIKACNKSGSCELSNVNAAVSYAIADSKQRTCPNGVIINISLGAPNSEWRSIRDAVREATNAGVFVAVAAGNDHKDAVNYSPASSPGACVAGAVDFNDIIANFSNYGSPVSVFTPGVDVLSTWAGSETTKTVSGTSMAAPHLSGLGAYLWGKFGKSTPATLCNAIKDLATKNLVSGIPTLTNTQNRLAFNGALT